MSEILIRDFILQDRMDYLRLSEEFYTSNAVMHAVPREHFERTFDQCIAKSPYLRGLALMHNGDFAGYALLSLTWSNEAGGLVVLLEEAFIAPDHQGSGLGSAFLRFVEEEYRDSAKRLRLEVTQVNKGAIRLYERMGYQRFDYLQMVKDF